MIILPGIWNFNIIYGVIFALGFGLYLSTLLIYFQHETWHSYFDTSYNRFFFKILCAILFSQPHIYDISHKSHHTRVNTYDDLEFYPYGKINNRFFRVTFNFLSIIFGSLFILSIGTKSPTKIHWFRSFIRSIIFLSKTFICWALLFVISLSITGASASDVISSFAFIIWIVSVFHHHNELIEHGNLIVDGDFIFRSNQTRNLLPNNFVSKLILFYAHQDSREHVLHHIKPSLYSRPYSGLFKIPDSAVYITFRGYLRVLIDMFQGKTNVITQK